ncbi:MAG: hypothetical protein NVSMB9_12090 [Isosphaeraceae bacterium]
MAYRIDPGYPGFPVGAGVACGKSTPREEFLMTQESSPHLHCRSQGTVTVVGVAPTNNKNYPVI